MALTLGLFALCLGWLAPNHYVPWLAFQQEWLAAVGTVLIGIDAVLRAKAGLRWPRLSILALAVAVIPLCQFYLGQIAFISDAVLSSLYIAGFGLAIVAGANLAAGPSRNDLTSGLFGAFLVAAILCTGMAAVQWAQIGEVGYIDALAPGKRPYANFGQPNHVATLLGLGLVATVWFFETRRIGAAGAIIAIAWLGIGITMTQSRTGWVIVAALAASVPLMRRRTTLRTGSFSALAALVIFAAMQPAWQLLSEALLLNTEDLGTRAQSSLRLRVWPGLVDAVLSSPWTGYGWKQVSKALYHAGENHVMQHGLFVNSHNLLLDLLIWNGVPIGALIIGALAWWYVRQATNCRDVERWTLLAGISAIIVHSMFEYPLEYAYFLLPLGLLMGTLEGTGVSRRPLIAPRWTLAVPTVAAVVMLGWISVEYMKVEESWRQARMVMAGIGLDRVASAPAPEVHLLDNPRDLQKFWATRARPNMSEEELEWMRKVVGRNPSPPTMLRYALAMGMNNRPDAAMDTLVRICHIHSRARCEEARTSWRSLQANYPQLSSVPFPQKANLILSTTGTGLKPMP
jgi:hypothetical protein